MIKFGCCHADTCLPDYWSGHHLPHVQIIAERGMTLAQVKSALHDELSNGYVAGSGELACTFDYDMSTDKERTEELHKAAHDAIDAIELKDPENDHCFMDVEESTDEDCSDSVYAFFVFVVLED